MLWNLGVVQAAWIIEDCDRRPFGFIPSMRIALHILLEMWPLKALMVASEAFLSESALTKQCRKSCQRQDTWAVFRATVHPDFQERIGFVGSVPYTARPTVVSPAASSLLAA
jgi:hypothetical protein